MSSGIAEGRSAGSEKLAVSIAQRIVRRICAAGLTEGAQLAPEAEMLAEFEVGRASLREALRILEVQGLISLKPGAGGGPVVARVSSEDFGRMSALYFQVGGMTFRELLESRQIMEPVLARLAAERRGEHPELVEELIVAARPEDIEDDDAYHASNVEVHRLVAALSGNNILFLFSHSLEALLHDRLTVLKAPTEVRQAVVDAHVLMARAIANGHARRAETLMREHMLGYTRFLLRRYPELMDEVVDWR